MRVNTDELERQARELRSVAGKLNDIQDSVLRIARNLGREQFGERFRYPLNSAAASIGRRGEELRRMRSALQQIAQLYERTETRIVDEAEHASVHHGQSGIGSVPIPGVGIIDQILDRDYPIRPADRYDGIVMPLTVPVAVAPILRDLYREWQNSRREESAIDRALDALEDAFRDQYGPVWISESSGRRMEMRGILDRMMEHVDDGVDRPDLDSAIEDVARIARESIRDAVDNIPGVPDIPEGMVDAIRDAINPGADSGYHPPHNWDIDIPAIDISDVFDGAIHDNTPPSPGNIADFIADGGVQINENIFRPLGPGAQAPSAADMIRNAADAAADAIASAADGLTGIPIASLDPVGPGIANQIISSIDGAMESIADAVPNMGGAIAGGIGNIDWTPWNP